MIVWRLVCVWFYVRGFDPEGYRIADAIDAIDAIDDKRI
jgi:hypothetical protein